MNINYRDQQSEIIKLHYIYTDRDNN